MRHEYYVEAVRVRERQPVPGPVGIGGCDRLAAEAVGDGVSGVGVGEVEHEQRFRVGLGCAVRAAGGQLQVRSGARDGEEHAVIAVVIAKAADLGQPEAVAVERDQLVEAVGVAGNAQLHVAVVLNGRATLRVTDGCGYGLNSVTIAEYHGPRAALRRLFELAEDSAVALDDYIGAGDVLVAIDDEADAIVGHVQIVETARPDEGEIKNMAVEPARRRSGIGRALVASAVHHARERSQSTLTVATAAADIGNLRFYQRLGFRFRSVERDAFTPATGYPNRLQIDGIELRDRVWLELCVDP